MRSWRTCGIGLGLGVLYSQDVVDWLLPTLSDPEEEEDSLDCLGGVHSSSSSSKAASRTESVSPSHESVSMESLWSSGMVVITCSPVLE